VLRRLRDAGIHLPRRQTGGPDAGITLWKRPSEAVVYEIIHNPAYAGAFVYGRHGVTPERRPGQPLRRRNQPIEEWTALHHNAYPAYIGWEEYMANQARLADNANRYTRRTRGAPRQGSALLVGIVVCGRCGRQMHVEYKKHPRYVCSALGKEYATAICLHLDAPSIDAAVVEAFFAALQPAELALLEEVLAGLRADHERLAQQYADAVKRAEYEVRLAQRQYQAVDPDNRLVAAELERRWELALRALSDAREAVERFATTHEVPALAPALRTQFADLGTHLPTLWAEEGRLSPEQKKDLLRSLIRRVILTRPRPDLVEAQVVWVSGALTRLTVQPPVAHTRDLVEYDQLVARVAALSGEGYTDAEIARRLMAEGFRSPRTPTIPTTLVTRLRRRHQHPSLTTQFRGQEKVDGQWTVWGLSRALHVDRNWLYVRIRAGTLPATRHAVIGHYLIPDDPDILTQLAAQHPAHRAV